MRILLNADIGESYGPWQMGSDELLMPVIDMANLACGGHASSIASAFDKCLAQKKCEVSVTLVDGVG